MGSIVTLGVGRLELDWGKNSITSNHSNLFQVSDKRLVSHFYVDPESGETVEEFKLGLARPLHSVKRRLEILGYTIAGARSCYERALVEPPLFCKPPGIDFDSFAAVMAAVDVRNIKLDTNFDEYALGDFASRSIFKDPEFNKTEHRLVDLPRFAGEFFENLHPYVMLRLLCENPDNLNLEVQWRYADLVENGWVKEGDVFEPLMPGDRWLIVTEGSSDGAIIRKALDLLWPDIIDFFDFVDMSENYPFTGSGNLYRFCQGLSQIRIQNKVLVVFDNDSAGIEAQRKVQELSLPENMRVVRLPDLPECKRFPTIGPNGNAEQDINGSALSIEHFLDLRGDGTPVVRWTAYNSNTRSYQGELVGKDAYTRRFMDLRSKANGYDTTKLESLLGKRSVNRI